MIKFLRVILVLFYLVAGINHFINPDFYLGLIPEYLPYHVLINFISGILEITFAIGVTIPQTRLLAVKSIVVLLILFIPSHIYFIKIGSCIESGLCVSPWIAWVRLVLIHPLLIYWAWVVRK
ncbi:DoxX family protein [Winogradskyella alexanderae]|uniref:DoxX family protein n=1 Tax=Winogradskyella alexanderae TaxID=2877123 RepID=A0ABS7XPB6_9FLAO|nr:hypothetical protein [Winogradskyella alexanderae]MCA0131852.1 hypothetical protein [Winogradskyella alexanderae]